MCIDVAHSHVVFTIPKSYREVFRKDREVNVCEDALKFLIYKKLQSI